MEKIAIISDIHGNLEALQTVLNDIRARKIQKVYCLGDILGKGIHLQECVNLVKENCEIVIKGNCEQRFLIDSDWNNFPEKEIRRILWNRRKISDESQNYLKNLPFCHEFYMSGRLVRLIHSHPENIHKGVGNIDTLPHLYELFLPSSHTISQQKADITIFGHIHVPFIQKIYNRVIINPGSVGNSFDLIRNPKKDGNVLNTTLANYLILSGNLNSKNIYDPISYELVNLSYDIEKELQNEQDNLEYNNYKEELLNGKYRDSDQVYQTLEYFGIKKNDI